MALPDLGIATSRMVIESQSSFAKRASQMDANSHASVTSSHVDTTSGGGEGFVAVELKTDVYIRQR
jgi:uncharacterized membrane protein